MKDVMYDVVIIGAGVAGTFMARELSKFQLNILLIDKENDVANETTMANSAIIHAGYDAKAGSKKGLFNASGNAMFDEVCEELDVPFKRCGSLVIGFDDNDQETLQDLYKNGIQNKVKGMRILTQEEIHEMEPNINDKVTCALYAPTAGIISPWELAIALAENAVDNGTKLQLETTVTGITKTEELFYIHTDKGEFTGKYVINCAGVYADEISQMVGETSFHIHPRKGHYFVLDKEARRLINHVIFQCPTAKGKGVLITPTVHGNLLIGPDSEFVDEKDNLATDTSRLDYIINAGKLTLPTLPLHKIIRSFAGLRATSDSGDFIIEEAKGVPGFINIAGFESPGLSSIPAVAKHVVELLNHMTGGLAPKDNFQPRRRKIIRFSELSPDEMNQLIKENSSYGKIVCRCETVTEGEIVDCIRRNAGARSVKAVKKRVRPGMGRCQGGFCGPQIVELLARELGISMEEVPYDSSEAYLLVGETKK